MKKRSSLCTWLYFDLSYVDVLFLRLFLATYAQRADQRVRQNFSGTLSGHPTTALSVAVDCVGGPLRREPLASVLRPSSCCVWQPLLPLNNSTNTPLRPPETGAVVGAGRHQRQCDGVRRLPASPL